MLIPKISVGSASKVAKSEAFVAVGSAVVFGTIAAAHLTGFLNQIPVAQDHITFALIAISFLIVLVATKLKSGIVRAIVIGAAGGSFFIALLRVPQVQRIIAKSGLFN